ncbi:MAG: MotA/TolQ/ExbB proton channel family protein [Sedimentisphaerales bacterium]|nr:MotA/TolQ/ExbB proton channel family protein [Sedimentisphaerales bacterium]
MMLNINQRISITQSIILLSCLSAPCQAAASDGSAANSQLYKWFFQGGPLVWVVLLPLSVVTLSLIIQYLLAIRRKKLIPNEVKKQFLTSVKESALSQAMEFLAEEGSFLARTIYTGLLEKKNGREAMDYAMTELIEQDATAYLRRIEWLNIIGNVAPMIGLLGTVWGMIHAFQGIVIAGGQPEPADLAGGISTALVTTWWGLIVAIPALAAYGFLRNRIDSLSAEVAVTAEELLRQLESDSDGNQ